MIKLLTFTLFLTLVLTQSIRPVDPLEQIKQKGNTLLAYLQGSNEFNNQYLENFLKKVSNFQGNYDSIFLNIKSAAWDTIDFSNLKLNSNLEHFAINFSGNTIKKIANLGTQKSKSFDITIDNIKGSNRSLLGLNELDRSTTSLSISLRGDQADLFLNSINFNKLNNLERLSIQVSKNELTSTSGQFFQFGALSNLKDFSLQLTKNKISDLKFLTSLPHNIESVSLNVSENSLENLDDLKPISSLNSLTNFALTVGSNPLTSIFGLQQILQKKSLQSLSLSFQKLNLLESSQFQILFNIENLFNLNKINLDFSNTPNIDDSLLTIFGKLASVTDIELTFSDSLSPVHLDKLSNIFLLKNLKNLSLYLNQDTFVEPSVEFFKRLALLKKLQNVTIEFYNTNLDSRQCDDLKSYLKANTKSVPAPVIFVDCRHFPIY